MHLESRVGMPASTDTGRANPELPNSALQEAFLSENERTMVAAAAGKNSSKKACHDSPVYKVILQKFHRFGYAIIPKEKRAELDGQYKCQIGSSDKAIELANKSLFTVTGDQYNQALKPLELKRSTEEQKQRFGGIGTELNAVPLGADHLPSPAKTYEEFVNQRNDKTLAYGTIIHKTLPDTPAERAGLQKGDLIVKVGDAETEHLSLNKVVDLMRGDPGQKLKLQVKRDGNLIEKEIVREEIRTKTVDPPQDKGRDGDIAYVRMKKFGVDTAFELRDAMAQRPNSKAFIIDLRNNLGGVMNAALGSAELFIKDGKIMTEKIREDSDPDRPVFSIREFRVNEKEAYQNNSRSDQSRAPYKTVDEERLPVLADGKLIIVMTNGGTASASEILTGALHDSANAVIFGENTYGKGIIQCFKPGVPKDGSVKLTCGRYETPSGKWPGDAAKERNSLVPDVFQAASKELKEGFVEMGSDKDDQLAAAVLYADTRLQLEAQKKLELKQ